MLNIIFMGTPDFAEKSLESLFNAGYNIIAVVTNQDKPKGRGMKMVSSPVKEFALTHKIEKIYQPEKVKGNTEFIETIKNLKPDLICVVAYGKILPKEILDIPQYGCINVHASLLPKYRGAAPIQWAVINGDKETGVTTMYMDAGMDTGDTILTKKVNIKENETTGQLWQELSNIGGELLIETVKQIEAHTAPRKKQGENFTKAPMITKEMGKIDWNARNAKEIKNLVRGLNPIMGAYTFINENKIKFWGINVISKKEFMNYYPEFKEYEGKLSDIEAGTIIYIDTKKGIFIKAVDEIVQVLEVQAENGKKMSIQDYLRGNKLEVGTICV